MLCFRKIPVAKKIMDKNGRGVPRASVEKILSHSAEKLRREKLVLQNFLYPRNLWIKGEEEGRSITIFCRKVFCLTVPKKFVGERFSVPLNSGIKKFMPKRGKSRFSIENLLCDSAENFRRGNLLCCFSENFR